ncbi:hypothetical protein AAIH25_13360 [Arthrobacter crystallopoietes]|jgi:hypothetical protein|uniref:hypothetical protein n=1 Tax=Crystallibacter crystallopoietes TaxID=37928 RepID=UPI003D1E9A52
MNGKPVDPGMLDVVRELADSLGPTLVAALTGNRVRLSADDWVMEDGPEPDENEAERLRCALEQWNLLAQAENPDTARAWFVGANPMLEDESPVTAIREGRFEEVRRAARSYMDQEFPG